MKISNTLILSLTLMTLAFTTTLQALSEPTASIRNESGKIHYVFSTWSKDGEVKASGAIKAGKTQNFDIKEIYLPIFLQITDGDVKKTFTFTKDKTIYVTWDGNKISPQDKKKLFYSFKRNVVQTDISEVP